MKKLFLLCLSFSTFCFSQKQTTVPPPATQNQYVEISYIKPNPEMNYGKILNENWKKLHQKRADNGTIIGWDVWWVDGSNDDSNYNIVIATLVNHPDSLRVNPGIRSVFPEWNDNQYNRFVNENRKSRKIIKDRLVVVKEGVFRGDTVSRMAVLNYMKVDIQNALKYENFEREYMKGFKQSPKYGWVLHKRVDKVGSALKWNYLTADLYNNMDDLMKERVPTGDLSKDKTLVKGLSTRDHVWSETLWSWMSIRKKE